MCWNGLHTGCLDRPLPSTRSGARAAPAARLLGGQWGRRAGTHCPSQAGLGCHEVKGLHVDGRTHAHRCVHAHMHTIPLPLSPPSLLSSLHHFSLLPPPSSLRSLLHTSSHPCTCTSAHTHTRDTHTHTHGERPVSILPFANISLLTGGPCLFRHGVTSVSRPSVTSLNPTQLPQRAEYTRGHTYTCTCPSTHARTGVVQPPPSQRQTQWHWTSWPPPLRPLRHRGEVPPSPSLAPEGAQRAGEYSFWAIPEPVDSRVTCYDGPEVSTRLRFWGRF